MSRFFSTTDQAKWCKMDHQIRSPSYKDWKQVKVLEIGCGSGRWARSLLAAEGEEMISNVTWQYFCDPNVRVSLLKTASSSNVKGISVFLLLPWLIESLFKSWNKPKTKKNTLQSFTRRANAAAAHKRSRNIWESTPPAPWRTNLYLRPKSFMKLFLLVWFWEKIR